MDKFLKRISEDIYKELGPCHLESVYHRAFMVELDDKGFPYAYEVNMPVRYKNQIVGTVRADLIIDSTWVVELKACSSLKQEHVIQLLHYMEISDTKEGFLINFPNKPGTEEIEIKRIRR